MICLLILFCIGYIICQLYFKGEICGQHWNVFIKLNIKQIIMISVLNHWQIYQIFRCSKVSKTLSYPLITMVAYQLYAVGVIEIVRMITNQIHCIYVMQCPMCILSINALFNLWREMNNKKINKSVFFVCMCECVWLLCRIPAKHVLCRRKPRKFLNQDSNF